MISSQAIPVEIIPRFISNLSDSIQNQIINIFLNKIMNEKDKQSIDIIRERYDKLYILADEEVHQMLGVMRADIKRLLEIVDTQDVK